MPEQELINYIKQNLAAGFSEAEIRQALIDAGWQPQEVAEAFAAAPVAGTAALSQTPGFFARHKKLLLTSLIIIVAVPALAYAGILTYQSLTADTTEEVQTPPAGPSQAELEAARQAEAERQEAQARARDQQRIADIETLETGLAAYFEAKKEYPTSLDLLVQEGFLTSLPTDPKDQTPYLYTALGAPALHYSLAFLLETDVGTLASGLQVVSSEEPLEASATTTEQAVVEGALTASDTDSLRVTDLRQTLFSPRAEAAIAVEAATAVELKSVILNMEGLRLTDRTAPFHFSFSAPAAAGEYAVQIFGFDKSGKSYSAATVLKVE